MNRSQPSSFVRFGCLYLLALAFATFGSVAYGSSYAPLGDEEHSREARSIWVGQAIGSTALRHEDGRILTRTVFEIVKTLKGVVPNRVKLLHEGGSIGAEAQINGFSPSFVPGAYYLVLTGESEGSLTALHGRLSVKRLWPIAQVEGEDITWTAESQQILDVYEALVAAQGDSGEDYRHLVVSPKEYTAAKLSSEESTDPQQKAVTATGLTEFEIPTGSPARPTRLVAGDRDQLIPYLVDLDALPAGMTEEEALTAVQNAVGAWEDATSLTFTFEGVTSFGEGANTISNEDGKLRLQLHDTYNQVGGFTTLGIGGIFANNGSYPEGGAGGRVKNQEFHIITNSYVILKHTSSTMSNAVTFEEVLGHEIGHAIGIAHSSETNLESNETLKEALMYYKVHGDGRGAALNSYDIGVSRKAYPVDDTPPVAFTRNMDIVTMSSSSTLGNPEVNQLRLFGYDRQTSPSALTVSIVQDQTSSTNGTFSISDDTLLNYSANKYTNAERLDPEGGLFYDRLTYRLEDGVNASPISRIRVISLSADSSPFPIVDGLPDAWVAEHFVGNQFKGFDDDADGDGLTNLEEYLQRTDPRSPSSVVSLSFETSAQTVNESDGEVRVKVISNIPSTRTLSFEYAVSGTADEDDFEFRTASLTPYFYAGDVAYDLIIDLKEDDIEEPNETIVLNLLSVEGAVLQSPLTHVVTIIDDYEEAPSTYDFSQGNYVVSEGDTQSITSAVQVIRSGGTSDASSVDVVLLPGSPNPATLGQDLSGDTITVNFGVGETAKAVPITIFGDTTDEPDENVLLSLDNFSSNGLLGESFPTAVLTIANDDDPPHVDLIDVTVAESIGTSSIPVELSGPSGRTITMSYTVAQGSATQGQDFNFTNGTLTLVPGQTSANIPFTIIDDVVDEPSETFQVTLSNLTNVQAGKSTAIVTIQDNDPAPVISVSPATATESESLGFTLTLNVMSGRTISVAFATQNGSALAGSDYVATSGTATFAPGAITAEVVVELIDDTLNESSENMYLLLSSPVNASLSSQSAEGTIQDNDPVPAITFSDLVTSESEGNVMVSIQLSAASGREVRVNYATQSGSAQAGLDFVAASGTLVIPAGSTQGALSIGLIDDVIDEPNESFTVLFSNPVAATLSDSNLTILIEDDDDTPVLTASDQVIDESAGEVVIVMSLSGVSSREIGVDYDTEDGNAKAGFDYVASSGRLMIPAGSNSGEIRIPIIDDNQNEVSESFTVLFSGPISASLGVSAITITIADDDELPGFLFSDVSVSESAGTVVVPVSLSTASGREVRVDYATQSGSAAAGSDFTQTEGTLIIASGETDGFVNIAINNDGVDETDETFALRLSNPVAASLISEEIIITIEDDDPTPQLLLSDVSVGESQTEAVVEVTLSAPSGRTIEVDFATVDATARAGSDYIAASGTIVIPAGEISAEIRVPLINDTLDEDDEVFFVSFTEARQVILPIDVVEITIVDDDDAPTLMVSDSQVDEGVGEMLLTFSLTEPSGRVASFNYTMEDETATAGEDYEMSSGTLQFAPGQTTASLAIEIIDDEFYEFDETFRIVLGSLNHLESERTSVQITIEDNDELPEVSIRDGWAREGGVISFAVEVLGPREVPVEVRYTTSDVTAVGGRDYISTSGVVTIPVESHGVVLVQTLEDEISENIETFTVSLSEWKDARPGRIEAIGEIHDGSEDVFLVFGGGQVDESAGVLSIPVTLDGLSKQRITFDYTTLDGTALAGEDYGFTQGSGVFEPGQEEFTIDIPIHNDVLDEAPETFSIRITNIENAASGQFDAVFTIVDDDPAPDLVANPVSVSESSGIAVVRFELSEVSGKSVSVDYRTERGTALELQDFMPVEGRLTIPAGETAGEVEIVIVDDELNEGTEVFVLELIRSVNAQLTSEGVNITIEDDDERPMISLSDAEAEEGSVLRFDVTLSIRSGRDVVVGYETRDNSALAGEDYQATSGELTILAGSLTGVIEVMSIDDSLAESNEHFTVALLTPINASLGDAEAQGVILDNDGEASDEVGPVLTEVDLNRTTGDLSMVWVGQPGQTAVLEHSEDMKTWVPIPSTEIEGNGEPQTIQVELADPMGGYYRLRVEG